MKCIYNPYEGRYLYKKKKKLFHVLYIPDFSRESHRSLPKMKFITSFRNCLALPKLAKFKTKPSRNCKFKIKERKSSLVRKLFFFCIASEIIDQMHALCTQNARSQPLSNDRKSHNYPSNKREKSTKQGENGQYNTKLTATRPERYSFTVPRSECRVVVSFD